MGQAVLLAARWAGTRRKQTLEFIKTIPDNDNDKEIIFLRDRVEQLQSQVEILRLLHKPDNTTCTCQATARPPFLKLLYVNSAIVQILDGQAELIIGGEKVIAQSGQSVLLPAHIPHAVNARKRFKMLLIMIREVKV